MTRHVGVLGVVFSLLVSSSCAMRYRPARIQEAPARVVAFSNSSFSNWSYDLSGSHVLIDQPVVVDGLDVDFRVRHLGRELLCHGGTLSELQCALRGQPRVELRAWRADRCAPPGHPRFHSDAPTCWRGELRTGARMLSMTSSRYVAPRGTKEYVIWQAGTTLVSAATWTALMPELALHTAEPTHDPNVVLMSFAMSYWRRMLETEC